MIPANAIILQLFSRVLRNYNARQGISRLVALEFGETEIIYFFTASHDNERNIWHKNETLQYFFCELAD